MELVEGEEGVVNLKRVEGSMSAAVNSLKHEYATSVTAKITPGARQVQTWDEAPHLPHTVEPLYSGLIGTSEFVLIMEVKINYTAKY